MANPKGGNRAPSIRIRGRHIFKYFSTSHKDRSNSQIMPPMPPHIHPKSTQDPPKIHPNPSKIHPDQPRYTQDPPQIHRKSIEHLSKIYRKSIEHLSTIYRTSVEHLSKIYRTSIDPGSTPTPPQTHPKSIQHLSHISWNHSFLTFPLALRGSEILCLESPRRESRSEINFLRILYGSSEFLWIFNFRWIAVGFS